MYGDINGYINCVQKRGNALMCYCRCQECGWNTTHTYVFHAFWKHDPGTFSLPDDRDYWKLSGNIAGVTNVTRAFEGGRAITTYQHRSDLSGLISCHKGEASGEIFSSFLTDFSKVLDNLK